MTEKPATPASPEVSSDDRLWALLCFLFTPLIPLVVMLMDDKKNRPFLKFHAVPTLIFGLVEAVLVFILAWIPIVNCIVGLIWIINIVWGIKAYNGNQVTIPVITEFAKNQGWI